MYTLLWSEPGYVVSAVVEEIGMIPINVQDPLLVACALASARVMDDPDNAEQWPQAFGRLMDALAQLHEREADQ